MKDLKLSESVLLKSPLKEDYTGSYALNAPSVCSISTVYKGFLFLHFLSFFLEV